MYRILCVLFGVAAAGAYGLAGLPAGERGEGTVLLHLVLSLLMFSAWGWSLRGSGSVRWTVATGVAVRLLLIAVPPLTTHDVDRYLFDGAVLLSGGDPYLQAPDDLPADAALRAEFPTWPEQGPYPSLYPPLAQGLFALAALFGHDAGMWVWKTVVALASCALLGLAVVLLRRKRKLHHLPLVAFSPLLVLEGGVGAHLDVVAALFVALALVGFFRGRYPLAGLALSAAALVKLWPLVMAIPLAFSVRPEAARRLLSPLLVALVFVYSAAMILGLEPLGSLFTFLEKWRFGSPLWRLLALLGPTAAAAIAVALGTAGLAVSGLLAFRGKVSLAVFLSLAVVWLAAPVVFPWYLAPLVLPLALAPNGFGLAWVSTLPLTYEVLDRFELDGTWEPAAWPLVLIAAGWAAGAAIDALRVRRRKVAVVPLGGNGGAAG